MRRFIILPKNVSAWWGRPVNIHCRIHFGMVHVSPQPPSGYISPNLQCSPTQSPIPVTVVTVDAVIVVVGVVCRPVCRNIGIILIVQLFIYSFTYLYNMFVHLSNDGVELVRGVVTKTWLHPPRCALGFGRRQISICNARPCTYVISRRVYWTSDRHFLGPIFPVPYFQN